MASPFPESKPHHFKLQCLDCNEEMEIDIETAILESCQKFREKVADNLIHKLLIKEANKFIKKNP
mgnify:CR=1 FL=1